VANTLAYYDTATITAKKSFIVQAQVAAWFPGMFSTFILLNILKNSSVLPSRLVFLL